MKKKIYFIFTAILLLIIPLKTLADETEIPDQWLFELTIKHELNIEKIQLNKHPEFFKIKKKYFFRGDEIKLAEKKYCSYEEDEESQKEKLPAGIEIKEELGINIEAIAQYLEKEIVPKWNQSKEDVRIYRDEKNLIAFEGIGIFGKKLDSFNSAKVIEKAILEEIKFATLIVNIEKPIVNVEDEELKKMGIKDLIVIGESDFSDSPRNRIHNLTTGANKFNAVLIPKGEIFSFNDILGPVNAKTGYKQELIIRGQQTIPDYGGGLCQVSTTAFRTALLGGFEIVKRFEHAYAVSHYKPWGTDATIYIGGKNFQFKNDTEGAILVQTRTEGIDLYFHFYGTSDDRKTFLLGPHMTNWRGALAARTQYTDKLAPGQTKIVSRPVNGFKVVWFRKLQKDGDILIKKIASNFQSRGLIKLVGQTKEEEVEVE